MWSFFHTQASYLMARKSHQHTSKYLTDRATYLLTPTNLFRTAAKLMKCFTRSLLPYLTSSTSI